MNGCSASDEVIVTVNNPIVDAGSDVTIIKGDSVLLEGSSNGVLNWVVGIDTINTSSVKVSPQVTSIYTLYTIDNANCSAVDYVNVSVITCNLVAYKTTKNVTIYNGYDGYISIDSVINGFKPYSFIWNNGLKLPVLNNVKAGNYSVTITDMFGCKLIENFVISQPAEDTVCHMKVAVNKTDVSNTGGNDGTIFINATDGTKPYQYSWSNGLNKSVSYNLSAGVYYITVTDSKNCKFVKMVEINEPKCNVDFDYTINDTLNNVVFNSISIEGTPTSYYWTMGDGKYSTVINPTKHYNSSGYYNVCLTTYDSITKCKTNVCKDIVIGSGICNAAFDYIVNDSLNTISITDKSFSNTTSRYWTVSNIHVSTVLNPEFKFNNPGMYDVKLTIFDTTTGCYSTKDKQIKVGLPNCISDFSYVSDPANNKVLFINNSKGLIDNKFWNFGDGSFSNLDNEEKTFNKAGEYNVCLTVGDTLFGCMNVVCKNVQVGEIACNVDFDVYVDSLANTAYFNAKTIGSISNYYWEFGDGSTASEISPIKVYKVAGYYNVKLNVYNNDNNCFANAKKLIVISNTLNDCKADFIYTASDESNEILFKDISVGANTNKWMWNYGDGTTSSGQNTTKVYYTSGYKNVCLNITDSTGCKSFICKEVIVNTKTSNGCKAEFNYIVENNDVYFTDLSNGNIVDWKWVFGDGETSSISSPVKSFNDTGFYNVTLTIKAQNGCSKTAMKIININSEEQMKAGFGYVVDTLNKKENSHPVDFVGASFGDPAIISWNFGDEVVDSTTLTPTHEYADTGFYNVCLTISSLKLNQTNTYCDDVHVKGIIDAIKEIKTDNATIINVYPNPFKSHTNLAFQLNEKAKVSIEVYDMLGNKIITLFEGEKTIGKHNIIWSPSSDINGIYFVRFTTNNDQSIKKIIINK